MGTPMRILRIRSKFYDWAKNGRREPYNSFGNGSAMRVGSVGFAFDTLEEVLEWSKKSALVTHNHAEGIRGAQATATAIFLAGRVFRKRKYESSCKRAFTTIFIADLRRSVPRIDLTKPAKAQSLRR